MKHKGFVLIELAVAMSIMGILLGFTTLSLINVSQKVNLDSTVKILIADIKRQQSKALYSESQETGQTNNWGIRFEENRYILFNRDSYQSGDPSDSIIEIEEPILLTYINLPQNEITFTRGNGEIVNFDSLQNNISVMDNTNGNLKKITFNKIGQITDLE